MPTETQAIAAVLPYIIGPHGGLVICFLGLISLAWKLRECERKHTVAMDQNARIAIAYTELSGAVNALTGRQVLDVNTLNDVLLGKGAVSYGGVNKGRRATDTPAAEIARNEATP